MRFASGSSLHASGALCIQCFAEAYAIVHCHLNGVPFTPLIGVILEFVSCHCLLLGDMVSLRLPIRTMLVAGWSWYCHVFRPFASHALPVDQEAFIANDSNARKRCHMCERELQQKKLSVPVLQPGCRVCMLLVLPDNALAVLFQEAFATCTPWRLSPIRRRSSCKTTVLRPGLPRCRCALHRSRPSLPGRSDLANMTLHNIAKKARAERGKRELVNLNRRLLDDWRTELHEQTGANWSSLCSVGRADLCRKPER